MSLFQRSIPVKNLRQLGNHRLSPAQRTGSCTTSKQASALRLQGLRSFTTYKFHVSQEDLDTVASTVPAVMEAGPNFTKHFYGRMFKEHPELLNVFNQTNQRGTQPRRLFNAVGTAATAALETGELPGEAIEAICQKHAALSVQPEAYDIVGENILGSIKETLTDDEGVIKAWASLYGDIAAAFISREKEIYAEMVETTGGWVGRRQFKIEAKEKMSDTITRFRFVPTDGKPTPAWKAGKFTTVWAAVEGDGPHAHYTEQPRHYTLAVARRPEDEERSMSISVKRDGLVSSLLHDSEVGTTFDLSAPYGCFDLTGVEHLWLAERDAPVVFLSGGVGITPVLAMLENIYTTKPATWLHSAENGRVHAYRERIREIAAVRKGELLRRVWYSDPTPEDGEPGGNEDNLAKFHFHGRMNLPEAEKEFPPEMLQLQNELTQYYMCGPPGWMEAQKEGLQSLGVSENRIHSEGF